MLDNIANNNGSTRFGPDLLTKLDAWRDAVRARKILETHDKSLVSEGVFWLVAYYLGVTTLISHIDMAPAVIKEEPEEGVPSPHPYNTNMRTMKYLENTPLDDRSFRWDEMHSPYVNALLSHTSAPNHVQITTLWDTGADQSVCSLDVLEKMGCIDAIEKPEGRTRLITASGNITKVIGTIDLCMTFEDMHDPRLKTTVSHSFNVVPEGMMVKKMILGSAFIMSGAYRKCSAKHSFILEPSDSVYVRGHTKIEVKLTPKRDLESQDLYVKYKSKLLPKQGEWIPLNLIVSKYDNINRSNAVYMVDSVDKGLKIAPISTKLDKDNDVLVHVSNITDKPIDLHPNKCIGLLKRIDRHTDAAMKINALKIGPEREIDLSVVDVFTGDIFKDPKKKKTLTEEDELAFEVCNVDFFNHTREKDMEQVMEEPKGLEISLPSQSTKKRLRDRFKLDHIDNAKKQRLIEIIENFPEVWGENKLDVGCVPEVEIPIHTDGKVFCDRFRPFPRGTHHIIMKILREFEDASILKIAPNSPYAMNVFLVKKPLSEEYLKQHPDAYNDPENYRLVIDGTSLNLHTIGHSMAMGTFDDLYNKIGTSKYLISLDIISAFHSLKIKSDHQVFTSFYTPIQGTKMCYSRLPMGLKNSSLEFCKFINGIFREIEQNSAIWVDDICLFADTFEELLRVFEKALRILSQSRMKMLPHKTAILPLEMKFCGLIWNREGTLDIPAAKIEAFANWKLPMTTRHDVASWLSSLNFYRDFLGDFAEDAKPFSKMLKKGAKIVWEKEQQDAFDRIINKLRNHVKRYIPPPDAHFSVYSDASNVAAGGRLTFKDADNIERLVACYSRTFKDSVVAYATYHKELMAFIYTLRNYEPYIVHSNCIAFVDAIALTYLALTKNSTPSIMRQAIYLSKFHNLKVVHIPGKKNVVDIHTRLPAQEREVRSRTAIKPLTQAEAEALCQSIVIPEGKMFDEVNIRQLIASTPLPSIFQKKYKCRCVVQIPPKAIDMLKVREKSPFEEENKTLNGEDKDQLLRNDNFVKKLDRDTLHDMMALTIDDDLQARKITDAYVTLISTSHLAPDDMVRMQKLDPECVRIATNVKRGSGRGFYIGDNGVLYKRKTLKHSMEKDRIVLPIMLFEPLMLKIHAAPLIGSHVGPKNTYDTLKNIYYFKDMKEMIQEYVDHCVFCQIGKNYGLLKTVSHGNVRATRPREIIAIDLSFSFEKTKQGEIGIMLILDLYSGFTVAAPIKSKHSGELLKKLRYTYLMQFQLPLIIRSDSETSFLHGEFADFCKANKIEQRPCSSGAQWGNGAAEKRLHMLKCQLSAAMADTSHTFSWVELLPHIIMVNNNTVKIGDKTPHQLMFNTVDNWSYDLSAHWPQRFSENEFEECNRQLEEYFKQIRQLELDKHYAKILREYNAGKVVRNINIGDFQWLLNIKIPQGTGNALRPRYLGPYKVIDIVDKVTAVLIHIHTGSIIRRHFNFLKPVKFDAGRLILPTGWDIEFKPKESTDNKMRDNETPPLRRSERIRNLFGRKDKSGDNDKK